MADNFYTIIIVPHARTSLRRLQVSARSLKYALITLTVLSLVSVALMIHYVKLYRQTRVLATIQQENLVLKNSLEKSQQLTQRLNRKISILSDLSNKLKVMAGLPTGKVNDMPPGQKLGLGGVAMDSPDPNRLSQLQMRANFLEKSFGLLNEYFSNQQEQLSMTPSILPTQGFISSFFGSRRNPFTGSPDFHEGLDITTEKGTPVLAPADGVVVFAGVKGNYGNVLEIKHSEELSTVFGHLDKILAKPGQKIKRWETVGMVGETGRTTGPHLHYEVHVAQQPVNPLPYILNLESFS